VKPLQRWAPVSAHHLHNSYSFPNKSAKTEFVLKLLTLSHSTGSKVISSCEKQDFVEVDVIGTAKEELTNLCKRLDNAYQDVATD